MKLSKEQLKSIVLDEVAKFGKPKKVEDVEVKEVDACDLADTLVAKKDFTVKEALDVINSLKLQEKKLNIKLEQVRSRRSQLNKCLSESKIVK